MKILGISAFYHDSAAAILSNGHILATAQEERFTRIKHDPEFPINAVNYCLKEANVRIEELDYIVFYEKPLLKFERLFETYLYFAPQGLRSFLRSGPLWLNHRLHISKTIRKALGNKFHKKIIFTKHHESHAASAFFPSPFKRAAIITIDGVGEWDTCTIGLGEKNKIRLLKSISFPNSLGLLYSAFTYFCGFKVNSGEYKLMGLAPYGKPIYYNTIFKHLIDLKEDGSFSLNMQYFNYCQGLTMTNKAFAQLFGGPKRITESAITEREINLAASIQKVIETVIIKIARNAKALTGANDLCLAGGVALNCVSNSKILKSGLFNDIWIQPASGDAGGALGAAFFVYHQLLNQPRTPLSNDSMKGSYLGPSFSNSYIKTYLDSINAQYSLFSSEHSLIEKIVDYLSSEKVIGFFQGRMEFGPRALGARSIIGDPRSEKMQSIMNLKIKFRESFRPFAPSVLKEDLSTYFKIEKPSPYMLFVAEVNDNIRLPIGERRSGTTLQEWVNMPRSSIPAVTHVDYSARIQTVDQFTNPRYYRLLKAFKKQTGCGLIINTSFNIRGEPIVCTPEDAYKCFMSTGMDILVLEDFLLVKEEQPSYSSINKKNYLASFALD